METVNNLVELIRSYGDAGFIVVFLILCICGLGLPVSKDGLLLSAGVVAGIYSDNHAWALIQGLTLCFLGVIIGDSIMFAEGRVFGPKIQRIWPISRILTPKRFAKIQKYYRRYGLSMLLVGRFTPVIRGPIYIFCGMSRRISYLKFLLINSISSGVYTAILVLAGAYLGLSLVSNLN